MKLATNSHHMSGHCEKVFEVRGQRLMSWRLGLFLYTLGTLGEGRV